MDDDGSQNEGNVISVGSGSEFAIGILDSGLKPDLNDEEAFKIAHWAIYHATYRDPCCGGCRGRDKLHDHRGIIRGTLRCTFSFTITQLFKCILYVWYIRR